MICWRGARQAAAPVWGLSVTEIEELEVKHRIAAAELGIIEELRWIVAPLATLYLEAGVFHAWLIPLLVGLAVFFLMPYRHSRQYDETWEAIQRATSAEKR